MTTIVVEKGYGPAKRKAMTGLRAFAHEAIGKRAYRMLALTARDDAGTVIGSIVGSFWMGVLGVQMLWVEPAARGKGVGRRLLCGIEEEARALGAVRVFLDTMSFQAPGFYRNCGYTEFGRIDGYESGIERFWFVKDLSGQKASVAAKALGALAG